MYQVDKRSIQVNIAMTITLVSWSMLFATLFLGYFIFRFNSDVWPPMEMLKPNLTFPIVSTVLIGLSSYTYHLFQKSCFSFSKSKMSRWILITMALGLGFIVTQYLFWEELKAAGYLVGDGIYTSLIYGFTWIHAGHVVLALLGLFWALFFTIRVDLRKENKFLAIINIGKFWHFLGIIWLLMFVFLFLI